MAVPERIFLFCFMLLLCLATQARAASLADFEMARLALAEGRLAAAEAQLDRIVERGVDALIAGDASWDHAVLLRGIARAAQDKLDAALADAHKLAKPRSSLTPEESGIFLEALVLMRRNERAAALAAFDRAVERAGQGMGSGFRHAQMLAARGWAHLYFGETDAARADFSAALASDGTILFSDQLTLHKPFWRAVQEEALPLFAAGQMRAGIERVEAIAARLDLVGKLRALGKGGAVDEAHSAAAVLIYEIQGGLAALRARATSEAKTETAKHMAAQFAAAQRALLDNDARGAFEAYVAAFQAAQDADGRDQALAGLATALKLLPQKPAVPEAARRLIVQAGVMAESKAYVKAIELYFQAYRLAPWHAQLFYDRALLIAQVARRPADFDSAIREMRRFLLLAPTSPDARAAQDKIYEWEARREQMRDRLPALDDAPSPRAHGMSATAAGSDCFIATAAFGSPLEPHVATLRDFRDRHLMPHPLGRRLVAFYYEHSPPLADFIRERETLRALVRALLVPVVGAIEAPWTFAAFLVVSIGGLFYLRRRRCASPSV